MKVTDALDGALSTLVERPAAILPAYFVGYGAGTVARTIPLLGLCLAYLLLLVQGRLAPLEDALAATDPEALGEAGSQPVDPEAIPTERLEEAFAGLLTPGVLVVVGVSVLLGLAIWLLVGAAFHAGQIHTVYAALGERSPVEAGVSGAIGDLKPFVGLALFEYGLYALVTVVYGLVVFVASALYAADPGLGLVIAVGAALLAPVWLLSVLAIAAVFVFAPQAVVVDRVGTVDGVRRGAGFLRRRPGAFVAYLLVALGLTAAVGGATALFAVLGVSQVASILTLVFVTPFLHLLKTGIYAEGGRVETRPLLSAEGRGLRARLGQGWAASAGAFRSAVLSTTGLALTGVCLLVFGLGTLGGYLAVGEFALGMGEVGDPTAVFGPFPVDTFVMIAANNWLVAVGQTFAGLAFGLPTVVNLLFNGAIVGLVAGLSTDLPVVAALVVPHALLEVPALAASGALGLRLGYASWRRARGTVDDAALASEIRLAFWALVGLASVFVVASFVEAFLTPRIAGWFL
ncbi:stage II sporulation protein M [Halalkalicoccus jeotgali]|uniref:Flagella cluster protein (Integral membrane protein) n=1 Tax=Halalkalicoccus jeotgali (strain DSM 18796 / CECT 7217 / JCM 14584 / KCTC 4019 / B3) TaxID=795797 RepID=D8J4F6_HALJB|nr:stage II sporulation protein M [Halalkalicoccus jeotgali]ADJ13518.1 flagella cluster protein (integral membrane protein) [Halalkalicoccus jeotgali B3]ELY33007.1 flagella integral membrane protein [Halalkalicoccus jeotgali B3]